MEGGVKWLSRVVVCRSFRGNQCYSQIQYNWINWWPRLKKDHVLVGACWHLDDTTGAAWRHFKVFSSRLLTFEEVVPSYPNCIDSTLTPFTLDTPESVFWDSNTSPTPPSAWWWVDNEWSCIFRWTIPLSWKYFHKYRFVLSLLGGKRTKSDLTSEDLNKPGAEQQQQKSLILLLLLFLGPQLDSSRGRVTSAEDSCF